MNHRLTKKQKDQLARARNQARPNESKDTVSNNGAVGILGYLRKTGPFGMVFGGIGLFFSPYFWLGIALSVLGAVLSGIDIWKEVVIPEYSQRGKIVFVLVFLLLGTGFLFWLFKPVSLELSAQSIIPTYGPGSNPYGIPWSDEYSQLDFKLTNPSDVDYVDFDAEVSTDLAFEGLKQTYGIVPCDIVSLHNIPAPTVQPMSGVLPIGPGKSIGGVPVGPVSVGVGTSTEETYRIRCDKLVANSEVTFVGAMIVMNPLINGVPPQTLFGAPKAAKWCTIKARFTQLGRPRSVVISECQIGRRCTL